MNLLKKSGVWLLFVLLGVQMAFAQKITLTGTVQDSISGEPLPGASVVLLQAKDSVQTTGISTDEDGKFEFSTSHTGQMLLRVSFMGYQTLYRPLRLQKNQQPVRLGIIHLAEDAQMLREAEVVAKLAQVEMKADTFIYNADAFRLPEGAKLEELIKKLPGAELSDDGTLKINGKEVSKIMVEGKDFFDNDTKMALKNLPSKMIKKIKAYDKKSDYTRITGIDDGEEETVLNLSVRKGMREGWILNTDVGYGTHERYTADMNLSRFMDNFQLALVGNRNNTSGRWGGGIRTNSRIGLNLAWDNGIPDFTAGQIKAGGNIRYENNKNSNISRNNSQMFLDEVNSTFSNNMSTSFGTNDNFNINAKFEWIPDSMTNFMFYPNFSHSEWTNGGFSDNVTFNRDPYETYGGITMTNPLAEYEQYMKQDLAEGKAIRDITINDNHRQNSGDGSSNNVNAWMQLNRRLGKPGRNITLNGSGGYSNSENRSFSRSEVNYYQRNSKDFTNQYNTSPSKSYNISGRLSYSEPIIGALNLQFSYQFQYRYSDNDRSMYSIDSLIAKYPGFYTQEDLYLGYLPGLDTLQYIRNVENSQYATYREYNHEANVMLRYNVGENRFNLGVSIQPQSTHMDYARNMLDTTVVRHTLNWSPRLDYRWKISNVSQLRVRFSGRMRQPGMTDLLEVTDSSDPLNISTGNSGLRSSWNNNMNIFYNGGIVEKQMNWMVRTNFNHTRNSISSATIYNMETGGRYRRLMNINGNWNGDMSMMFSSALDKEKHFNFHTFTNLGRRHNVSYLSSNSDGSNWDEYYDSQGHVDMGKLFSSITLNKSKTNTTNINESMRLNYRNDLLEVGVNGGFNYAHSRSDVQRSANLDTWSFNYGGNFVINTPWGLSIGSDISQQSRRGYEDASMNTNELIWNAQASQSFLKNKAASIGLEWFDILGNRSNISRNISATMRSDSWTNAIHSYVMLHFRYSLNLLGNKDARSQGGFDRGRGRGGWGGGGRGGWGGGRGHF